MSARPTLQEAKARLDVPTLWRMLNLPGQPSRSCRCPLHEDGNASFSMYVGQRGGLRWKCHAGCGHGGPIELLARVLDIPEKEACRRLLEMADTDTAPRDQAPRRLAAPKPPPVRRLLLPTDLHPGNPAELWDVAEVRALSFAGVQLASTRGLLWFATPRGCPAWIVLDAARVNAQARRMDGGRWAHLPGGQTKAWTLPGSRAPWPIGTREVAGFPFVVLVEGAPDLLAAHHFILAEGREGDVAAVAMLGGTNIIPEDASKLLTGKRVRIFPHADPAGQESGARWTAQLESAGCTVDTFRFAGLRQADGRPVKDLNDLASIPRDSYAAQANNLERILPE